MRIIAIVNQKGGVGKTTSVINLGAGLARHGRKVLMIDMDPQAGLTYSLGIQADELTKTIYDVLGGRAGLPEVIIRHGHGDGSYDFIPSNIIFEDSERELGSTPGRELVLKEAIEEVQDDYDYILIDAPPRMTLLTMNVLVASREIFIPLQTEYLALNGIKLLLDSIAIVKQRLNPGLEITGIIATLHHKRRGLDVAVMRTIKEHFGKTIFKTTIRRSVALAEAPSHGKDIFEYSPRSQGAKDYEELTLEVMAQERKRRK